MVTILSETETIKAVEEKEFIQMKGGYVAYENRECLNCQGNQIHEKHPPHQKERCDR